MSTQGVSSAKGSQLLRGILFAFMLLVMGVNAADAAECGPEVTAFEIVQISGADETPDPQPVQNEQQKHGVCPHGHCHSGNVAIAGNDSPGKTPDVISAKHHSYSEDYALSAHIARLKRPPRV
ncbi:hypothetical protein MNBD_ALPHA04-796 [hydrothermal vent metagenome]|uniref:Uncharacterized protein n=1 Tax=hydrothermal vent metagenome TaxID=652676 RepID=A0A3B0RFW5_9ZZZZ